MFKNFIQIQNEILKWNMLVNHSALTWEEYAYDLLN